jgi:exopolysaccharide biosynthesis polyprenyl glycosylphosphotransferase
MSLTHRTLASIGALELPVEQLERPQQARRRDTIGRIGLVLADAVAVVFATFVVMVVFSFSQSEFTPWVLAYVPLYALLAKMAGLYDRDQFVLHKTTLDEAPTLVAAAAIFALSIEGLQAIQYTGGSHPLPLWAILTVTLIATRALVRFVVVRHTASERVVVVGDASTTALIRRRLSHDPSLNATVVGRVGRAKTDERPDKLLGSVDELPDVIQRLGIERVLVSPTHEGGEDMVDIIRLATACGVRVAVLPRMLEVIGTSVVFDDLGGQVLLGVRGFGLSPSSQLLKRTFDLLVGSLVLLLLSPLLLMIVLAIRLGSHGPVLFRQTRVGRLGREFQMLKFRTMVDDADERKHQLLDLNAAAPMFKIPDDPRATRVGRFLRRRSLDELPQLINVLRGDMSLVGPRPLITEEDRLFSGWQRRRYHVAPGVTGPWQILGSSRVPMDDMLTIDYLYCANWSLWLDAKILARTIPYVLSRRSPEYLPNGD